MEGCRDGMKEEKRGKAKEIRNRVW